MMVKIQTLPRHSPAYRAGLRPGDKIETINGHPIIDILDLRFYAAEAALVIKYIRHQRSCLLKIVNPDFQDLGITVPDFNIRQCRNRCVFCFVDQMPNRLRKTLYIKDEDFRLSFLHGAYITAS